MRKLIAIGIIFAVTLTCITGCNTNENKANKIDLSGMDKPTIYDEYTINSVIVIDGKVYYCHELEEISFPKVQILRCDTGKPTVIYEGRITDVKAYGQWLYYNDWDYSVRSALWRIDLISGKVEKVLEDESEYTVCPAGIFWVNNKQPRSIMHAELDGSNISTIFELGEKDYRLIGGIRIYHQYLYFSTSTAESPKYSYEYYRVNLKTGIVEKPEQFKLQKSNDDITRMSEYAHQLIGIQPIKLWIYELPGALFAAEGGWMFYYTKSFWYDPETQLNEPSRDPVYVYKIREDGTQKTELFTKPEFGRYIAVRDGWVYSLDRSEKGDAIYRVKEDGSKTQTIIEESCKYKDCIDGYLYYSLLYDKDGKPMQDNLYRLSMDTLGEPEQLY